MLRVSLILLCLFALLSVSQPFLIDSNFSNRRSKTVVHSSVKPAETMKLKEIQDELKRLGVSYKDCFDKESLIQRYKQAQEGKVETSGGESQADVPGAGPATEASKPSSSSSFDRDAALQDLRAKRISELREECGKRRIRWGNFVEKEDMIQAILANMEASSEFSATLSPGVATSITGDQLKQELETPHSTPMLLDVYATWCGPCQMFAGQLSAAAEELGSTVRVAKLDSDKFPEWAGRLKAGGLPTVILFDEEGREQRRIEGAMSKEQVLQFVRQGL